MVIAANVTDNISLDDFMANPPDHTEWVDGQLIETTGMTIKHSRIQSRLDGYWRNYISESGQGGEPLVELPCRTLHQGRRPDVSYLTSQLLDQYGDVAVLPQSPPLIAEIASPTDTAEDLFAKATEYLESGCQEVWLVFPETRWILVITQNQTLAFRSGDVVSTQVVLTGFSIAVDELFA
ncbi:MAG: Uma2 family endonuclease [Coleofasciculus sp. G1-WW12-02]|uniref:Uma2 family endonuclease n=1 Tax=Coleofasciculus sp. G1-WW12-02 TaxID=3068483 RepID=UPI0032F80CE8